MNAPSDTVTAVWMDAFLALATTPTADEAPETPLSAEEEADQWVAQALFDCYN
jgi:hypothetical protein